MKKIATVIVLMSLALVAFPYIPMGVKYSFGEFVDHYHIVNPCKQDLDLSKHDHSLSPFFPNNAHHRAPLNGLGYVFIGFGTCGFLAGAVLLLKKQKKLETEEIQGNICVKHLCEARMKRIGIVVTVMSIALFAFPFLPMGMQEECFGGWERDEVARIGNTTVTFHEPRSYYYNNNNPCRKNVESKRRMTSMEAFKFSSLKESGHWVIGIGAVFFIVGLLLFVLGGRKDEGVSRCEDGNIG